MKYRRKPEPDIEAFQYLAGMGVEDLPEWMKLHITFESISISPLEDECGIYIGRPAYASQWAKNGDYIAKGPDEILIVIAKNHFESLYEPTF